MMPAKRALSWIERMYRRLPSLNRGAKKEVRFFSMLIGGMLVSSTSYNWLVSVLFPFPAELCMAMCIGLGYALKVLDISFGRSDD